MEPLPGHRTDVLPGSPGGGYPVPGRGGKWGRASVEGLWVGTQCGGFKDRCRRSLYCDVHMDNALVTPSMYCEGVKCGGSLLLNKRGGKRGEGVSTGL